MTKREKILLGITVTAAGASLCMFAFVSLAHFLKATPTIELPLATKLYENTVAQLSTLDPISTAAALQTTTTGLDTKTNTSALPPHQSDQLKKKSNSLSNDSASEREESTRESIRNRSLIEDHEKVVTHVLNELGIDQNTIKMLELERLF